MQLNAVGHCGATFYSSEKKPTNELISPLSAGLKSELPSRVTKVHAQPVPTLSCDFEYCFQYLTFLNNLILPIYSNFHISWFSLMETNYGH